MDKLRLATVTPSKKKKQRINFKNKVKKLIVEKKVSKNDDFFVKGAFNKAYKVPEVKILSDVTQLLLKSVQNKDAPDSVDNGKSGDVVGQLGTGNWTEIPLSSTTGLENQQRRHNVLKCEKLKDDILSTKEKQNPEVAKIRHTQGKKTEQSTVIKSKTAYVRTSKVDESEADGQKCFKIENASNKITNTEVSTVMGLNKKQKRRKKRKRKDSNADIGSGGEGKGAMNNMDSNKEQRKSVGNMLGRKSDTGQGFQVSNLSQDERDKHGKEKFSGRQDFSSCLYDSGKGATNSMSRIKKRRRSGGKKSDTGQGFQVCDLSPDKSFQVSDLLSKSEICGKGTSAGKQESDNFISDKGALNKMKSSKEQRRSGRKSDTGISQGFQVSNLSKAKSEICGKGTLGGTRDSGNVLSDNFISDKGAINKMKSKEQRRSGRKSDTGISQGFQVADLSEAKSEICGKGILGGIWNSVKAAKNDTRNNKERRRSGGTMLGRKSDIGQGFQVSDFSSCESEIRGKGTSVGRRDSDTFLSGKGAPNYIKSKKEQRRSGRKSDLGISQGFQVSDLSPDESERLNISCTTSPSKDTKILKKWNTNGVFGNLSVDSKLDKPESINSSKADSRNENDESEIEEVSETLAGLQVVRSTKRESEVLDTNTGINIRQEVQKEVQNWNEKNTLHSTDSINEEGSDSTIEPEIIAKKQELDTPNDREALVSNLETGKVLKKRKSLEPGNNYRLEPDEGLNGETYETSCEEVRNIPLKQNNSEHKENNSAFTRKETRRTVSIESVGMPDLMSDRLQLIQFQERQDEPNVCLENFLNFKLSRPTECKTVKSEDKLGLQFYRLPDNRYVLLLKQGSIVHFRGKLTVTVLAGGVEILGSVLQRRDRGHGQSVFSPRGSSLLALEVQDLGGSKDCMEVAVEAVSSVGMQKCDVNKIEANYEEGDCLLLLEVTTSFLYAYLGQQLPGQLFPTVETTKIQPSMYHLKELQCTFYLPNYKENIKVFVKNEKWENIVQRILDQNQVASSGPASCTMVCGGKGVGKSTLLRYLVNRALSRHSKVLCLDFDPGQAEFTVPGCLSAVLVSQPLLGPNYTHLTVPQKSVYLGHINVSQCPALYLEAVSYIVSFCRDNPEFFGIPWFVNTMGFCKGLGVELTKTVIQMVRPTDLVQIQSQSKQRNFPSELQPYIVAKYQNPFRYIVRSQGTVGYQFHLVKSSAESKLQGQEAEWGFNARTLREIVVLSYLGQMVKPPTYSLTEIVPYMTSLSNLKLRICHESVSPSNVLCVMNGCMVALCCTDSEAFLQPSEPDLPCVFQQTPCCDCLGFGVIRGVDMDTKKVFIITPVPADQLSRVNCLVMGIVQLPACVLLNPVGTVGHVPYVTIGPGQPTGRSSHRSFTQLLLAGTV